MKKKRIMSILALLFAATFLAACGSKSTSADVTASAGKIPDEKLFDLYQSPETGTMDILGYTGKKITNLVIPSTLDGKNVTLVKGFMNHKELKSVVIPDTVTCIGDNAFTNCMSLETVKMGKNITEIDSNAFLCCPLKQVEIPDSVTVIYDGAFGATDITEVRLPSGLTELTPAFATSKLKDITIPKNVKVIDDRALEDTPALEKVVIEEGVTTIGQLAFDGDSHLTSVTIPASVTAMGADIFLNSDNVTVITPADSYAESYAKQNNIQCKNQ